ncbi:MAG: glycosyltransferase family 4 protein [Bacteroidia bacterium]|nr:glycosyltransferase family 4 protein [Bacteroidia bacterium]
MNRELRIALLTDGIFPYVIGGMQKHSWYLARYLARSGAKVDLFFFREQDPESPAFTEKELENINLHELKFPKMDKMVGHYVRESFEYSDRVFKALQPSLHQYDFIYAKGFTAWKLLDARRKGLKCPPIAVNFHGLEMFQKQPSLKMAVSSWMLRYPVRFCTSQADINISYGGKITGILQKILPSNSTIWEIPTGIEATWLVEKAKPASQQVKFLFVGRFERRKGVPELNEVLKKLVKEISFEFHFIGPIPPTNKVLHDKVKYHGKIMNQDKMRDLVQACDVLVTPSHSEGMPNVIMESMASGLAVIATNVGAVADMVGTENGWLLEAGHKKALEGAIREAAGSSPETLLAKKQASIDKVRNNFLWDQVVKMTLDKIENRIGETGS